MTDDPRLALDELECLFFHRLERVEAVAEIARLRKIETAAAILASVAEAMMPEQAACGHDRRWLLSVMEDLRAALEGGSE